MAEEFEEEEVYVLLDFQGKDPRLSKQSSIHFKMLNLSENRPILEMGGDVYEGTYDDAIGTNVFFEEVEDSIENPNVFEGRTPISLKYLVKQTKVLKMKKVGVRSNPVIDTSPIETMNIKITDDYKVLLEKYQKGELNIEDCICEGSTMESEDEVKLDTSENEEEEAKSVPPPPERSQQDEELDIVPDSTQIDNCKSSKYAELKILAQQPIKHKVTSDSIKDPVNFRSKDDFLEWKKLVMKRVEEQPINLDIQKNKIEDYVDIQKSVQSGIISSCNSLPRIFTDEEKSKLISFKNFMNLSVFMKLVVLHDLVKQFRLFLNNISAEQLNEKDESGCTTQERFSLLKDFKSELHHYIVSRLKAEEECNTKEEIKLFFDDE